MNGMNSIGGFSVGGREDDVNMRSIGSGFPIEHQQENIMVMNGGDYLNEMSPIARD